MITDKAIPIAQIVMSAYFQNKFKDVAYVGLWFRSVAIVQYFWQRGKKFRCRWNKRKKKDQPLTVPFTS